MKLVGAVCQLFETEGRLDRRCGIDQAFYFLPWWLIELCRPGKLEKFTVRMHEGIIVIGGGAGGDLGLGNAGRPCVSTRMGFTATH